MVVKSSSRQFANVFSKPVDSAPKKAESLSDIIEDYMYDIYNRREVNEKLYGDKFEPAFHPSQLVKAKCARKMVLEFFGAEFDKDIKYFSAQLHRIFQNGHDVHDRLQRYLADLDGWTNGKVVLVGRWFCKKCGSEFGVDTSKSGKRGLS